MEDLTPSCAKLREPQRLIRLSHDAPLSIIASVAFCEARAQVATAVAAGKLAQILMPRYSCCRVARERRTS